jgi:hypothetical protein
MPCWAMYCTVACWLGDLACHVHVHGQFFATAANEAPKGFMVLLQNGALPNYFCVGLASHCVANSTQ